MHPRSVTTRAKQNVVKSVRKPVKANGARRRFQIALPHMPRANVRSISVPRPRFGWRLVSFVLVIILGAMLYFAFDLPELRVAEASLNGNQLLSQAEVNNVLNISGQPIFLLTPSDLETRLPAPSG